MQKLQPDVSARRLGAGRSGQVFFVETLKTPIARKIFFEDRVATLIHAVFFGAPNPYVWNQDAIAAAYYRRKILKELVIFWFQGGLDVADAIAFRWNSDFKAYQLDTKFVSGRHVALQQPFKQRQHQELEVLTQQVMKPLQKHLIAAGFDGLLWQVGKGSPSALNNFMLTTSGEDLAFVWIDMESGVPALFPFNLLELFRFYLPKSIYYRRALFDDVNLPQLQHYVIEAESGIKAAIGSRRYNEMCHHIAHLENHQQQWKGMRRCDRSIQYHVSQGHISSEQADCYRQHPIAWYGREAGRLLKTIGNSLCRQLPSKIIHKLRSIPYGKRLRQGYCLIISQRYRVAIARQYITARIHHWHHRHQINDSEAEHLLMRLNRDKASDYINDFSVHLGLKLFVKSLEYVVVPSLFAVGAINGLFMLLWLLAGGPVYRTLYTLMRMVQALLHHQEVPWVAFWVGLLPIVGAVAYPVQIIYSATGKQSRVAQFIVYDIFTRIGSKIPAWGGEDTATEHFFNHWASRIIRSIRQSAS